MQRAVSLLTQRCTRLALTDSSRRVSFFNNDIPHSVFTNINNTIDVPRQSDIPENGNRKPVESFQLPALENPRQIYTFPTLNRSQIFTPPPFLQEILEKVDPSEKAPIISPNINPVTSIQLAPRLLTIRRKKMKKHKRRKRYDRDYFKYQKYHREKKLKAEREFVRRMKNHLAELEAFDSEKYVDQVIAEAKKEWSDELAPTGRKLYPHWSRLMTLEELYGLPKTDYIDKKSGLPSEEDLEKIKSLKQEYDAKFKKGV